MSSSTKPFAFVLMPFDTSFDDVYKIGIKKTLGESGIICERVDEQRFTESMLDRIYRQISSADFIIADMSGKNPNVFYELGYAHALKKTCTLLTNDACDIPFDLKHHRHLVYGSSIDNLQKLLLDEAQWLKSEFERKKSGTFEISFDHNGGVLDIEDWQIQGQVDFLINVRNISATRSPQIDEFQIILKKGWRVFQDGSECHLYSTDDDKVSVHSLRPTINHLEPDPKRVERYQRFVIPSGCETGRSRRCLGMTPLAASIGERRAAMQAI